MRERWREVPRSHCGITASHGHESAVGGKPHTAGVRRNPESDPLPPKVDAPDLNDPPPSRRYQRLPIAGERNAESEFVLRAGHRADRASPHFIEFDTIMRAGRCQD